MTSCVINWLWSCVIMNWHGTCDVMIGGHNNDQTCLQTPPHPFPSLCYANNWLPHVLVGPHQTQPIDHMWLWCKICCHVASKDVANNAGFVGYPIWRLDRTNGDSKWAMLLSLIGGYINNWLPCVLVGHHVSSNMTHIDHVWLCCKIT